MKRPVTAAGWSADQARHFWAVFANYQAAAEVEGLAIRSLPRVLNSPGSALAETKSKISIPGRATTLTVGVELAFVLRQLAYRGKAQGMRLSIFWGIRR